MAYQAGVRLVELPFFDRLATDPTFDITQTLESRITPDTSAIYLNTPSNPTGVVLKDEHLDRIAEFARRHDLWVFADEAYEDFIWSDVPHRSIGSLPGMWERTVSVYTFSKCFGASGVRVGYVAAPAPVVSELNRCIVGSCYHVGRLDQLLVWRGLKRFRECLDPLYQDYRETWDWTWRSLKCRTLPSEASFYFFVYLGDEWVGVPPEEKIQRMLDAGVVLSPGEYFGDGYDGWARLCFTVVPPDELRKGVDRLNRLTG